MIYLANIDLNQNELQNAVIQPLAVAPTSPRLGQIYCNSSTSKIMWYNGSSWATIGVIVESSAVNGHITVDGVDMTIYSLPAATESSLGGIKVGPGLSVTEDGTLSTDSVEWINVLNKPTALSAFTNDENFIDNTVESLVNYYKKTETYTQTEVNTLIGQLATIQILVVDNLPTIGESNIIYLIPKVGGSAPNSKDEYLWTGSAFEKIGDTEINLNNYLTQTGELADTTVTFNTAVSRVLPVSTEATANIIGKITRYLTDLKSVAFTGSYSDIIDKPREYIMKNVILDSSYTTAFIESDLVPVSVEAHDTVTGEFIIVDYTFSASNNPRGLTISIASSYPHSIVVTAIFPVSKASGDTFND